MSTSVFDFNLFFIHSMTLKKIIKIQTKPKRTKI
jgi:hypothetical protein